MKSIIKFYVYAFGKFLQINTNEFFPKNYVLKKGKILMFYGKELKRKMAIRMHYSQSESDI